MISRKRRHAAMLEQGMHSGNTDAKFDPPDYGCCSCGRHASDQCDLCKRLIELALSVGDRE